MDLIGTKTKLMAILLASAVIAILDLHSEETLSTSYSVYGVNASSFNISSERAGRSVVQVTSKIPTFLLNIPVTNSTELSSGFFYDANGHVITTYHGVVGSTAVYITLADGKRYSAIIKSSDPYNDIAVLEILGNVAHEAVPLEIGNSSNLLTGEQVVTVGHPKLEGQGFGNSITSGIISNTKFLLQDTKLALLIPDIIQTDAIINPGNSGGPLLNAQGQVIGIIYGRIFPTVFLPGNQYPGLTLAIPSNVLTRVVPVLIEKGNYTHPFLGLSGCTLTPDIANKTSLLFGDLKGVIVNSVVKDGPADKAGINGSSTDKFSKTHVGDLIIAIDGHPVTEIQDLISYIDNHKSVFDHTTLKVFRHGQVLEKEVILQGLLSPLQYLQTLPSCPSLS
jgi:S1-C subfamily serine protease